jgi:hypothetical protein
VSETLRLILTKFTDETITVFSTLLLITMAGIIGYWFYNRKKFHQLSHEIPASVVKNYLDSIIQNSNSLKSSLFRGGGLDMGNGVPSVAIVANLPSSTSIMTESSSEEINQKNAEIASLSLKLNDRTKQISDLEKRLLELEADRKGGDPNIQKDLTAALNERNILKERLKEYEIIEEDLANLKRFRQENDQLKTELAALKKSASQVKVAEAAVVPQPIVEEAPPIEVVAAPPIMEVEEEIDLEAEMAKAIAESKAPTPIKATEPDISEVPAMEDDQKSAEELLSEFEKMLG